MNYEKIGNFIALKRKEKGLTQKELALHIGVTDKAVSKWERGLGCPDVSILEVLANELGVSILEILKGRIIEDEVIKVTEMNDYVKETVDYTKHQYKDNIKKIFSNIIVILIIIIVSYVMFLNIHHIVYLNQKYEFNFDNGNVSNMNETINKIEKNINIIKDNKGIFKAEEHNLIVDKLIEDFKVYKSMPILEYKGTKKFSLNDLSVLDIGIPSSLNSISILQILETYDSKLKDYSKIFRTSSNLISILESDSSTEFDSRYRYKFVELLNYSNIYSNISSSLKHYKIFNKVLHYQYLTDSYYYLTELIIEVGELSE